MWLDRIGVLISLFGFLLLIPEILYGIIGTEKLDQLQSVTLRSLRALSLLQKVQRGLKVSQQTTSILSSISTLGRRGR